MTAELQGVQQNPDLSLDSLRRLSAGVNNLISWANRPYSEAKIKSISASQTIDDTATVWLVSSTAQRTLTLPDAAFVKDRVYTFIKTDSSTRAMKLTGYSAAQTINGSTANLTTTQYGVKQIITDGIKWYRIL